MSPLTGYNAAGGPTMVDFNREPSDDECPCCSVNPDNITVTFQTDFTPEELSQMEADCPALAHRRN